MSQEKIARFQSRVSVPVGKDSSISFGKMRDALPADYDCLIYIPLDASGRKITWSGEMAKSAADYVFIAMSKNGVFSLTIPTAEVFKSQIKGQSRFMVLSNNLLACSGTTYSGNGKFEVSGNLLRFPSGEQMMLPWLTHAVTRKLPETGEIGTFAFGWLDLVHYSSGGGFAYHSTIPLMLVNPFPSVFPNKIQPIVDSETSLYAIFSGTAKVPEMPASRMVEATVVCRLSMQRTIEITYSFDWAEFFKIDAFYYHGGHFAVRFRGEDVRLLNPEVGQALKELIRSPKYIVYFKEFAEMAIADRVTLQDKFSYATYLNEFMADPAMGDLVNAVRKRAILI